MARLPHPGSDDSAWGDLLNEFLRVAHNDDGSLKVKMLPPVVDTMKDLEALNPALFSDGQVATVRGFDAAGDGCGGVFQWYPTAVTSTLEGVVMNSKHSGVWTRLVDGPLHTRWAGIKPTADPKIFDAGSLATNNRVRWNNLSDFCKRSLWELVGHDKANVVVNTIFVDAGIHDFDKSTVFIGQGVGVDGVGPGRSVLRFNSSSGTCLQVGDPGDRVANPSLESAFDTLRNVRVVHFTRASTGSEIGVAFDNTVRRSEMVNVHVQGFNINVAIDAFGMDLRHCFFSNGYTANLRIGPQANSMMIVGCRIDDQRNAHAGAGVAIDSANAARNILLLRCDIQRTQRVALQVKGVASIAIRDCFFEGNNRANGSHPDVWIGGSAVRNVVIDGCYFTGTGRFKGTTSRAINVRANVTANARLQISNNQQADSAQGTFASFIDIDANVAMTVVAFNNLNSAKNAIGPKVTVKTLS